MSDQLVRALADLIEDRVGHVVREGALRFLAETIERRCGELALEDPESYVSRLRAGTLEGEWDRLLDEILVHESYLFRGVRQLLVLVQEVLPELMGSRAPDTTLRFWSAGCSRGEEAVTLALLLAQEPSLAGWKWSILATDVDPKALQAAREGVYVGRSIREVPPAVLDEFFEPLAGGRYRVRPEILEAIDYRLVNLVREPLEPPGAPFDAILLRNVLIYFRPQSQTRVVDEMAGLLTAHGYLVAGPTESLWQIADSVRPVEKGGFFFYRPADLCGEEEREERHEREFRIENPRLQERLKDHQGAQSGLEGSARGTPDPFAAAVEAMTAGRLDEVEGLLPRYEEASRQAGVVHGLRGLVAQLDNRDTREVVGEYRRALFLVPHWFQIRLLVADVLLREGEERRADGEYRRILSESGELEHFPHWQALGLPSLAQAVARAQEALKRPPGRRPLD